MACVGQASMQAWQVPQWSVVLAAPAQARFRRQLDFQHRRAVGEDAVAMFADGSGDAVGERLQAGADDLVVVAPKRVARNEGGVGVGEDRMRVGRVRRQVVEADADDAQRAGHKLGRPAALGAVRSHIIHLAMKALIQPRLQARLCRRQIAVGDADRGEAEFFAPALDLSRECL